MRHITLLLLLCTMVLSGCRKQTKAQASTSKIEAVDKALAASLSTLKLPMSMGNGMTWLSLELEGSYLVYTYQVDEKEQPLSYISENAAALKANMKSQLLSDPLLALAQKSGVGIKFVYSSATSSSPVVLTFEPGDF